MKIQTGPSYPYRVGKLPTPPVAPQPAASAPVAKPNFTPISPLLGAGKVHVFSPVLPAQSASNDHVVEGIRAVTKLIASHCGLRASLAVNTVWLAVDGVSAVQTLRDPESSKMERMIEVGSVAADGLALLAGVLVAPRMEQTATAISFAVLVGDHLHTGKITLSQSEIAAFSSHPQAEAIANLLKLSEVVSEGTDPFGSATRRRKE